MSEDVGGISYSVDADTKGLLQSTKDIEKAFADADKAARLGEKGISKAFTDAEKSGKKLATSMKPVAKSVSDSLSGVEASARQATGGLKKMGRGAGQAGIQLQQFVGQVQGGQDPIVAFGQQAADVGIVLGAPLVGVVLALGSALVGSLIPAFLGAGDSADVLIDKIKELQKESKLTAEQAAVLIDVYEDEDKAKRKRLANIEKEIAQSEKLRTLQDEYTGSLGLTAKELRLLAAERATLNQELAESAEKQQKLNAIINGETRPRSEEELNAVTELIKALEIKAKTLGATARAQALHAAYMNNATQAEYDQINAIYDAIEAKEAQAEAEKALQREQSKAQSFADNIINTGMSPLDRLSAQNEKLKELRDQDLIDQQTYASASMAIDKQVLDAKLAQQDAMLSNASQAFGGIADVLKQSAGEQSGAYKAMFAVSKSFAIAQAGLNLSTALSQALADPTAITLPQKLANYGVVASAAGSLVSEISEARYGGGREHGGPVSAGSLYEVGERNKPEILSAGGKQFMIPGNNGRVFSNEQIMGGGGVTINNYASGVDVIDRGMSGQGMTAKQVIDIVDANVASRGRIHKTMTRTLQTSNKIGGGRRN